MKTVRMVKVIGSSLIAKHGWNEGTMFITFVRSGKTYRYSKVTQEQYNDFVESSSLGVYFTTHFQKLTGKVLAQKGS